MGGSWAGLPGLVRRRGNGIDREAGLAKGGGHDFNDPRFIFHDQQAHVLSVLSPGSPELTDPHYRSITCHRPIILP